MICRLAMSVIERMNRYLEDWSNMKCIQILAANPKEEGAVRRYWEESIKTDLY
jgi:hypothetical protein